MALVPDSTAVALVAETSDPKPAGTSVALVPEVYTPIPGGSGIALVAEIWGASGGSGIALVPEVYTPIPGGTGIALVVEIFTDQDQEEGGSKVPLQGDHIRTRMLQGSMLLTPWQGQYRGPGSAWDV